MKNIDASIYPLIIKLEENEFFFKKYIFYYTQEELDAYTEWYPKVKKSGKSDVVDMLEMLSEPNVDLDALHVRFLLRLLIKVPFFCLAFPKAVLREFDEIVQTKINATRGETRQKIKELDQIITRTIEQGNMTTEAISDVIFNNLMEE
nr:ABC-three component system middle component 1 [Desulfitobacterium hafniense]